LTDQTGREHRDDRPAASLRPPRRGPRARSRRAFRNAAFFGLVALAFACLGVGGFFLLLSQGPISLTWLAPRIVAALNERFAGQFDFHLGGASLASSDHGPTLTVDGLVVKSHGRAVLAAPRAEVSLDLPSLLVAHVQPRRLEVLDLDLRLSVQADGTIAISAGADPLAAPKAPAPPPADPAAPPIPHSERVALLKTAAGALRALMDFATSPDSPVGALDKLGLQHARLTIDDRTIDRTISYKDVALSLTKGDGAMRFSLSAKGPSRRWVVTAAAKGAPGQRRQLVARVRDLTVDEISLIGGVRRMQFDTDAPLGLDLNFTLAPDDIVLEAKGGLEIGKGFFRLEDPDHEPVMIDRVAAQMSWDRRARKLLISPVQFKAGGFDLAFSGEADAPAELPAGADPGADAWTISLKLMQPTKVTPERAGEKIVVINDAVLQARLMHGQGRVLVDRFAFSGPEVRVASTASLLYRGGPVVSYELDVDDTQIRALARLWPTHVVAPVRAWFVDHVPTGAVKHAHFSGSFDDAALTAMRYGLPPADDALEAFGEIVNGSVVDVLPGMGPLTGVAGRLHITGRTATFEGASGGMETSPGRRLTISEGRFSVADNALRPTPAVLDLRVAGSVEAVSDLLSLPAISSHASIPVEPGTIKGQIDGKLRVDFEIGDKVRDDSTTFAIDATASNLVIEKLIGKERLDGGNLHVVADRTGLRVNGTGRIYGAPATLDVRRGFGEKGPAQAQLTFSFDEAARQRAGYVFPGVSGSVAAIIKTPLPVEDLNTHIELDMTRTAFDNPIPGLSKPAGKPARAAFVLTKRGEGMALEQFSFDAGSTQAQGVIELGKDGAFHGAKLAPVRLSSGDDLKLDVSRAGDVMKVVARGSNFDARPMLAALIRGADKGPGGKGGGDDVDVDFKAPIVTGHGKQILSNVDFKFESRGGRPRTVSLLGNFGREQLAVAMTRGQGGAQQLEISTNDAGSLLGFVDLYRKMESGVLNASFTIGQGRADGSLNIRDFYVKGEPTMRQLMAQSGSSRTDDRGVIRFDPDSVRVGRLQSYFNWSGGRLGVREGVMSGPEIGLTFDGYFDFPRDRIDVSGSYVPAYALNSLLSNIPVVGVVITGGQHEGIFALNYRVTGSLSSPVVNVNPLSAIAPGLMRKIMGVLDGTARMPER